MPFVEAQKLIESYKIEVVNVVEQSSQVGAGALAKGTLIPTVHPITGPRISLQLLVD